MKNKTLLILILLFFSFCFVVFLKGLKTSNVYIPETTLNKDLAVFSSKDFSTDHNFLMKYLLIVNFIF